MRYDPSIDPEQALLSRIEALGRRPNERNDAKRIFFTHALGDLDFDAYRSMQAGYLRRSNLGTYVKFLDIGFWYESTVLGLSLCNTCLDHSRRIDPHKEVSSHQYLNSQLVDRICSI